MLERLVSRPPPRTRDRALGADVEESQAPEGDVPAGMDTVDVACWTSIGSDESASTSVEPRATLLAAPATSGEVDGSVVHTLVLEIDKPTTSVEVDYRSLDTAVVPERGVRIRTDDDRAIGIEESQVTDDGVFTVRFAERPTDGAVFLEYNVTNNPDGGRHAVGVVVDGERRTEARLVVVG